MGRLRRLLAAIAVDASLLRRRRDFRLLVSAQVVSLLGSSLTLVAIPFQVYDETGSTVLVGALGIAEFVPIVILALVGGALADAFDRRRLMLATDAGSLVIAVVLAVNATLDEPQVWVMFACASVLAALYAVQRPAMDALFPRLIEPDELKTASALHWLLCDVAFAVGPALGGVLLATAGAPTTYLADAASFGLSFAICAAMRGRALTERTKPSLSGIKEGAKYAVSRQELLGSYLVDMNAMFFGVPNALFPALAAGYGGPAVLGAMFAAVSIGSVIASATSGWSNRVHRNGRAVVFAASVWGVAIIGFGLADALWLALVCLAVAGGADAISGIFRSAIWNEVVPDRLRGRLAGIEMISYSSGPTLGQVRSGWSASALGLRESVIAGGVACVAGCFVVAAVLPRFWSFKSADKVPNT